MVMNNNGPDTGWYEELYICISALIFTMMLRKC